MWDIFYENCKIAWQVLQGNWLRTILTALSVALGAGAISLMVSLSQSGMRTISSGIESVGGSQLIFIFSKDPPEKRVRTYDRGITREDVEEIKNRVPGIKEIYFLSEVPNQLVSGNGKKADITLLVGKDYLTFAKQKLILGEIFQDDRNQRQTVIPEKLAVELFGSASAALHQSLIVFGHRYEIIGVTRLEASLGFNMGINPDKIAAFPVAVMAKDEAVPGPRDGAFIVIKSEGVRASHDLQMRLINAILLGRHQGSGDFEMMDLAQSLSKWKKIFLGLEVLTGTIAAVSLVIAGAGMMNVMLASVRQRVIEIGIRRALGASEEEIKRQFLIESLSISAFGGLIGSVAGLLFSVLINLVIGRLVTGWQTSLSFVAAGIAVFTAALCGIIFGLRPAKEAARLNVVSCLRGE